MRSHFWLTFNAVLNAVFRVCGNISHNFDSQFKKNCLAFPASLTRSASQGGHIGCPEHWKACCSRRSPILVAPADVLRSMLLSSEEALPALHRRAPWSRMVDE